MMNIFATCQAINSFLIENNEQEARNELIKLLDYLKKNNIRYSKLVNSLIRSTGLYPYLDPETSDWQEKYIFEVFKVNVGNVEATLHREQSSILSKLLEGNNIALSAPTSFGKSFIIDAFITLKNPKNVVIIVPTIALADETRRRLYKKFSNEYKIITLSDSNLSDKNIFIFPQERAINYVEKIQDLDMLIIDEFYKASSIYEKERSSTLIKAIIKLGEKAKQKYFLAPNIEEINDNMFTRDMLFENKLNFNTVYLEVYDFYKTINENAAKKAIILNQILTNEQGKTLIYAASYPEIETVASILYERNIKENRNLLESFKEWLRKNYGEAWSLFRLIDKGIGIHNGRMHRSLSQIQIKLFDEPEGIDTIISTSSIIEGINTSAENIVIWKSSIGLDKLNTFTYKNIIGRGGRMFKHFIGKVYLLEEPPVGKVPTLEIPFPDDILIDIDEIKYKDILTDEQIATIINLKNEMCTIMGEKAFYRIYESGAFNSNNYELTKAIIVNIKNNESDWRKILSINTNDPYSWSRLFRKIMSFNPVGLNDIDNKSKVDKIVDFIENLSYNWERDLPRMLRNSNTYNIDIDTYFDLERKVTYHLSLLVNNINIIQKEILNAEYDLSELLTKISNSFLPHLVYQLEEYGLPRMISKKIQNSGLIDLEDANSSLHDIIIKFKEIKQERLLKIPDLDHFDTYIIKYFYDGITLSAQL